ncbi:hypothetical protein SASPL_137909 [Salvia splendens]|uniref:Retrotransposon gag domain-containing protein n=1 Tax=Salvia splendens TaxID=180675 RepID=A0A8X8WVQ2_SALSN|nr:hypothetical protein SASPL_137909 [Salvia splendens]
MASASQPSEDALAEYSIQELGQMLFDEAFSRQQAMINKSLEDHLSKLLVAVENLGSTQPKPTASISASRGWSIPMSVVSKPPTFDLDSWPKLKFDPPRFGGDNVVRWIKRIQKYYNHSFTPLADRLYLTEFLLDDAVAKRFSYWEDNNNGRTWDEFLITAKLRFDLDLYDEYMGRLATLRQSGSLNDYLKAFQPVLQKVGNVGDSTLTSLFIAGLSPSLNAELLTRRPASLGDAMALAQQLSACHSAASIGMPVQNPSMDSRDTKQITKYTPPHSRPTGNPSPAPSRNARDGPPRDYPIVRVSAAEKAEKAKRGPDIILGVQWLQDLGEVTKNYKTLSMKFKWEDRLITLQG